MLRHQPEYEDVMYKSWSDKGGGVKLKLISLQIHNNRFIDEADFKKTTIITQILSLSYSDDNIFDF